MLYYLKLYLIYVMTSIYHLYDYLNKNINIIYSVSSIYIGILPHYFHFMNC